MKSRFGSLLVLSLMCLAPSAAATRGDFLRKPFVEDLTLNFDNYRRFDLPEAARSLEYGDVCMPKAPCFHAFSVGLDLRDGNRFSPKFPYNLKFPTEFYGAMPASVTALIERQGIAREKVEIYCEFQDQPYRDEVQTLFRPQGWTDPGAPYQDAKYRTERQVRVGILEAPEGVRFSARADGAFFPATISVLPRAGDFIMSGGPNLSVDGLDYHKSQAFWTVVQLGDRVAATLHILLNDADEQILETCAQAANVLELKQRMEASRLHGSDWLEKFKLLTRLEDAPPVPSLPQAPAQDPALLWKGGATRNLIIPMDGIAFEYQSTPCQPGEVFVGEAQVQAATGVKGRASIGLRFDSDARQNLGKGEALPDTPMTADLSGRVRLGVRGKAPAGADRVTCFIRTEGCTPWGHVDFEGLSFARAGAPVTGPQPIPWKTTLTAPEKGTAGLYHSIACVQGERFTGEAFVQTAHMTKGKAQLGMVFQGAGKALRYGVPLAADQPNETASPARIRLGVQGEAPKGADTVQFYLQAYGCNPGAQATFDAVAFRKRPEPGSSAPQAEANLWKTTLKAPASGVAGEYQSLPCRPGAEFTGECFVQTRGLTKGSARISVAFFGGGKTIRYARALGHGVDFESRQAARVRIGVRDVAPAGADTAQVYIQIFGANEGAQATFDSISFTMKPPPASESKSAPGPVVHIPGGDRTVLLGEPLVLQADGTGKAPYKWFRDGKAIPGTMSAQVVDSAGLGDAGEYQVEASGAGGTVRSDKVKVTVLIPGEPGPGATGTRGGGAGAGLSPVPTWAPGPAQGGVRPAVTLLPLLTYEPSERNQGQCGNCYAWAAHAAIEMELFRKYGIRERLSVQYYNSVYRPLTAGDPPDACCKANPELVARTYLRADVRRLIPWNNPNAQFQDREISCTDCEEKKDSPQLEVKGSRNGRAAIPTEPFYPLQALSFAEYNVTEPPKSQAQVQTYIKEQLNQGKLVIYNNSRHYTVIVGYDDRPAQPYWIILDSFGVSSPRDDGSRKVLMEAINFAATQGLAVTNSIEVLNELELDLHGQGVVSEVRVTPGAVDAVEGQPLTLTARVKAYPPVRYAWSKAGQALPGETGAILAIPRIRLGDAGVYEAEARLSNGATRKSGHVTVSVRPASGGLVHHLGLEAEAPEGLAVRVIPRDLDVAYGADFTLVSVLERGKGPFKRRWLFNGQEIPGQTGPSLLIQRANPSLSGEYQVEISNGQETVRSLPPARVRVSKRPGVLEEKK